MEFVTGEPGIDLDYKVLYSSTRCNAGMKTKRNEISSIFINS